MQTSKIVYFFYICISHNGWLRDFENLPNCWIIFVEMNQFIKMQVLKKIISKFTSLYTFKSLLLLSEFYISVLNYLQSCEYIEIDKFAESTLKWIILIANVKFLRKPLLKNIISFQRSWIFLFLILHIKKYPKNHSIVLQHEVTCLFSRVAR